jgi:CubicO group peptidase (beta-lactamase class C family)
VLLVGTKNLKFVTVLSSFAFCLFSTGSAVADIGAGCQQTITQIEKSLLVAFDKHHASISIQQGDDTILSKSFGPGVTSHTRFLIGSVTKTLHATVAVQLMKDGLLNLDDKVGARLPEEVASQLPSSWRALEIRNLLHHTSGIPDYMNRDNATDQHASDEFLKTPHDISSILSFIPQKLEFAPDTDFRYSNTNYLIMGRILENVTNVADQDLLRSHLTSPLHLEDTGTISQFDTSIQGTTDIFPSNLVGVGNVYSTSSDLMTFLRALDGESFLPQSWVEKMYEADPACHGANCNLYGLGFRIPASPEIDGHHWFYHQGHLNTVSALVAKVPDLELNMSLVSDRSDFDNESLVRQYFASLIQSGCVRLKNEISPTENFHPQF